MPLTTPQFPLPPGSTIGVLGSGQLGRMLAMAAARLGLKCHIYADAPGPAFDVTAQHTIAPYDDFAALTRFAATVAVVTYEFENVPVATVRHLETLVPVRPGSRALEVAQDRVTEKTFISGLGIPVAPFAVVSNAAEIAAALTRFAAPAILKTRRLGYDGKGQLGLKPGANSAAAFAEIGGVPAVLELKLAFQREISVLIARSAEGATCTYDIPTNEHANGILARSTVPSDLDRATLGDAAGIAGRIAAGIGYVGVLAVELFDFGPEPNASAVRLVVNEIAPRVHNSGHWTTDACAVSQFENHMRAVAGWPLGSPARHSDAVMQNLIGPDALAWPKLAAEPGCCLHL